MSFMSVYDGVNWGSAVATGTFRQMTAVGESEVLFAVKTGQYVRLRRIDGGHTAIPGPRWPSLTCCGRACVREPAAEWRDRYLRRVT